MSAFATIEGGLKEAALLSRLAWQRVPKSEPRSLLQFSGAIYWVCSDLRVDFYNSKCQRRVTWLLSRRTFHCLAFAISFFSSFYLYFELRRFDGNNSLV